MIRIRSKNSFVLIFALWVLGLLTVLAVSVATGVRQKMILVKKLEERSRLHYVLEAAVNKSRAYVTQEMGRAGFIYTPSLKVKVHNNPLFFGQMALGADNADVSYTLYDQGFGEQRFGLVDEERKLNINTANEWMLQRLLERVLNIKPEEAKHLADAILDWRQWGTKAITGFFSDEYYANLEHPYHKKDANYEILDELLLVKGITKEIYQQILPYVTIYGDGKVNINTAPAPVLAAVGLEDDLAAKILTVRRGKDGVEGTADDHVFAKTFDVATEVQAAVKLDPLEINAIDALNVQGYLSADSFYFSVDVQGHLAGAPLSKNARAVISVRENLILYWREK